MPVINQESGTTIDEIADGIYRISTPVPPSDGLPPGFTFNQYLIVDDKPLLYHTGPRQMFPLTLEAIASVMPVNSLRYVGFSHVESDECGALNNFLAVAPHAEPLCSDIAAMVSIGDIADRAPRGMADGETIELGRHSVTWIATPHLPHAWECGHLFERQTRTLFCGDLFTQMGAEHPAITEYDILESSEQARAALDYYSHTKNCSALIDKLAAVEPMILACMHGASWRGDGAALLQVLGQRLDA
ncbi:MAG: MBL fold metallo-hydrolase [Alphaproteobacteria bacterium]|nr:MBL fold metallo-hydrolase [Alphaproteobacteria bacterium]MBL6955194.1 MBL fold metallo-hydrolase [Alphaproteobacteria bacterium]